MESSTFHSSYLSQPTVWTCSLRLICSPLVRKSACRRFGIQADDSTDRWSGEIKPVIPFIVSKWIFAACIILSWVFLVHRWLRALRAMRSGGVAQSYLDPLGVRIQSIRMGSKGRGWRRFLVFAELTKSKKGSEYVALFTYFSFEGILSTPRP